MRIGLVTALLAGVAIGAPASAHAQQTEPQAPGAQETQVQVTGTQQGRVAGLPPADQPMIRRIPQPIVSIEGGGGVVGFVGGAGSPGPAWNLRVTGALSDRFSIEGNYLGSVNDRSDNGESLVMTAIDAGVRYNVLLPEQFPVQPFVVAGAGYAGFAGNGGDPATMVVPLVAGAERLLTPNIKVGARFSYRPAFFDDLSLPNAAKGDRQGADTWTLLAQIGGGF
ncbi:MAG: outer membrane beta-barrel protein [Polyangiaceae bacterium]|nr:outer membrane beta-barrel protein [Polyangiaceae bacterium]